MRATYNTAKLEFSFHADKALKKIVYALMLFSTDSQFLNTEVSNLDERCHSLPFDAEMVTGSHCYGVTWQVATNSEHDDSASKAITGLFWDIIGDFGEFGWEPFSTDHFNVASSHFAETYYFRQVMN
jgi:hypothetical protein